MIAMLWHHVWRDYLLLLALFAVVSFLASARHLGLRVGLRFSEAATLQAAAMIAGWFVLLPACFLHLWEPCMSPLGVDRPIDRWRLRVLGLFFDNPEDGVSGQHALIWQGSQHVPYWPTAPAWLRAYIWCAWRNSADALKYVCEWGDGPLAHGTWLKGREWKIGWQPLALQPWRRVPVWSF